MIDKVLETKIGKFIAIRRSFSDPDAGVTVTLRYRGRVLGIDRDAEGTWLLLDVSSENISPNGLAVSGTWQRWGETLVKVDGLTSLDAVWAEAGF